jgi:hypothetical protein
MKVKIIIFAALLLFVANIAGGQIKKADYEKAIDYLNCKTVELSLKSNAEKSEGDSKAQDTENYNKYKKDFDCNGKISSVEIIKYLNDIKYTSTAALSKEIENLKKSSFNEGWKAENATEFLTNEVFKDNKYPKLSEFADKRRETPDFVAFRTDLKEKLPTQFSQQPSNTSPGKDTANADTSQNSNSPIEKESGFSFMSLIPWLILLLLAGYIVWNRWALKDIRGGFDELRQSHNELKSRVNINLQKPATAAYPSSSSREVGDLRNELDELKSSLQVLYAKFEENKKPVETANRIWQEPRSSSEPKREVFYLSTPNKDGSFNQSSVHTAYQEGGSIYRFTKTRYGYAEFQIDENPSSVKLALEYADKNIDPVCEAVNAYNPKAERIMTMQPGRADLEGDKWIVSNKAKIRYDD